MPSTGHTKYLNIIRSVLIFRDGKWVSIKPGDKISANEKFRTARRSKLHIAIPGMDKIARIKPNTMMTLKTKKFQMEHGNKLWFTLTLLMGGAEFMGIHTYDINDIRTPKGVLGTRGTVFTVDIEENSGKEIIEVTEGAVEYKTLSSERKWIIKAGGKLTYDGKDVKLEK